MKRLIKSIILACVIVLALPIQAHCNLSPREITNTFGMKGDFNVYPQSVEKFLYITMSSKSDAPIHFELIDITGQVVVRTLINNNTKMNLSHLKKGIYLYKIIDAGRLTSGKIIKE